MTTYSISEAKTRLPSLIDQALEGEQVVITRHGKPIIELHPAVARKTNSPLASYSWLRARRLARPSVSITSVDLLNDLHSEG